MIHGFNSGPESFDEMKNFLLSSGKYLPGQVMSANYKNTSWARFNVNKTVVSNYIQMLLYKARSDMKLVSGQIDIVGHSMGGILSRFYIQSSNFKNDINKLITLNTPHSGSPWGTLGCEVISILSGSYNCPYNAITDLSVLSWEIRNKLNGYINPIINVPVHSIVTETLSFENSFYNSLTNRLKGTHNSNIYYLIFSNLPELTLSNFFNGEEHDLIVSVSSQKGGLSTQNTTLVSNQWHGSTKNPYVISSVFNLLNTPTSSLHFSPYDYNPVTLTAKPNLTKNQINTLSPVFKMDPDSFKIISPLNNTHFPLNAVFSVDITTSLPISRIAVICDYNNEYLLYSNNNNNSSNQFLVDTIFDNPGPKRLLAIGIDTLSNIYYYDTLTINIDINNTFITQLRIDSLLLVSTITGETPKITALTNHGQIDFSDFSELNFYFYTNNAGVENGKIIGYNVGYDSFRVEYNGIWSNISKITVIDAEINPCLLYGFNPYILEGSSKVICSDETTTLNATGGAWYQWSTGATTSNITVNAGTYSVTISNFLGCNDVVGIVVYEQTNIPSATVNDQTICAGQSATLTATGATSYVWSNGATSNTINVSPVTTSTYTVTGITNGCQSSYVRTSNSKSRAQHNCK
ncbi:MAG: hypothetical protein IPL27_26945 [Lewinellaceae bacterium]|nr:hypothetical protein [Lewinellaceae bacterium]